MKNSKFIWYPNQIIYISECHCNEDGSVSVACDEATGKCTCHEHITGDKCDQPIEEYFGFPTPQRM